MTEEETLKAAESAATNWLRTQWKFTEAKNAAGDAEQVMLDFSKWLDDRVLIINVDDKFYTVEISDGGVICYNEAVFPAFQS